MAATAAHNSHQSTLVMNAVCPQVNPDAYFLSGLTGGGVDHSAAGPCISSTPKSAIEYQLNVYLRERREGEKKSIEKNASTYC